MTFKTNVYDKCLDKQKLIGYYPINQQTFVKRLPNETPQISFVPFHKHWLSTLSNGSYDLKSISA